MSIDRRAVLTAGRGGAAGAQSGFLLLPHQREPATALPDNLCYMMVNGEPREAISVQFDDKLNDQGVIEQTQIDINQRSADLVAENFRWAGLKFGDMFS